MKIKLFTIPNCITLLNLLCGVGSIIASVGYGNLQLAFILVAASAIFDFMDGLTARLLGQYSAIGVELDSLADMVSFGVAPAMSLYVAADTMPLLWQQPLWGEALCYAPLLIPAFSALRLAKFNIDDTQHEEFCGLPTPANAIFCLSLAALCAAGDFTMAREWMALVALVMSVLLVSPVRMFSFKMKSKGWRGNELRFVFLAFAVVTLLALRRYSLPIIIVVYIVVSTIRWAWGCKSSKTQE